PTRKMVIFDRSLLKRGSFSGGPAIIVGPGQTAAETIGDRFRKLGLSPATGCRSGRMNALVTSFRAFLNILAVAFATAALINFKVAFAPVQLAVAFEGQDVRRQTIEEPAVVRGHHHAAGEVHDRFFE